MPKKTEKQTSVEPGFVPTSTAAVEGSAKAMGSSSTAAVIVALNRAQGVIFSLPNGRKVEVCGNAVHLRGKEMGVLPSGGAFGLTPVERADWEEIKRIYGRTSLFKSGRIFAQKSQAEAMHQAQDHAGTRHGLEPSKGKTTEKAEAAGV